MGLSPADLAAVPPDRPTAPAFAGYVPVVSAAVSPGTRRAYGSYWNRVVGGVAQRRRARPATQGATRHAGPGPLGATMSQARVTASDRADTVVEIRPSDESHEPDNRAAEQTRVEYAASTLLVKAPRQRSLSLFGKPVSIDVMIELPAGSQLRGNA